MSHVARPIEVFCSYAAIDDPHLMVLHLRILLEGAYE